jgi:hypothetical protein
MLLPNSGARIRPARISRPILVTPETNTAVSGRVGSLSGPNREAIAGRSAGSVLNAPLATRQKRRI